MHLSRSFFLSTEHGQKSFKFLNMSGLPNSFCKNLLFIINNFFSYLPTRPAAEDVGGLFIK